MTRSDIDTVARIAALARLDITGPEAQALAAQFSRILEQFQVLAAEDVEGVEPMLGGLPPGASQIAREDSPRPSSPPEALLGNAPARVGDFYGVPKTVGGLE